MRPIINILVRDSDLAIVLERLKNQLRQLAGTII